MEQKEKIKFIIGFVILSFFSSCKYNESIKENIEPTNILYTDVKADTFLFFNDKVISKDEIESVIPLVRNNKICHEIYYDYSKMKIWLVSFDDSHSECFFYEISDSVKPFDLKFTMKFDKKVFLYFIDNDYVYLRFDDNIFEGVNLYTQEIKALFEPDVDIDGQTYAYCCKYVITEKNLLNSCNGNRIDISQIAENLKYADTFFVSDDGKFLVFGRANLKNEKLFVYDVSLKKLIDPHINIKNHVKFTHLDDYERYCISNDGFYYSVEQDHAVNNKRGSRQWIFYDFSSGTKKRVVFKLDSDHIRLNPVNVYGK